MSNSKVSSDLYAHWFGAGIASAMARFIPLPLVDDIVDDRAKRYAVSKTLKNHNTAFDDSQISKIYGNSGSIPGWIARKAISVPIKFLVYPARKIIRVATAIRGVPRDFSHTFLLARAVDRAIAQGLFENKSEKELQKQAKKVRDSFDTAFSKIDSLALKSINSSIKAGISKLNPKTSKAIIEITGKDLDEKRMREEAKQMSEAISSDSSKEETANEDANDESVNRLIDQFDSLFDQALANS